MKRTSQISMGTKRRVYQASWATLTARELEFFQKGAKEISEMHEMKIPWQNFPLQQYMEQARIMVYEQNGELKGFMLSRLTSSIFNSNVILLVQDLLYTRPGTRASYYLMQDFIDFGKANADHLISMVGKKTNIKGKNLERLGFSELEVIYRMETNRWVEVETPKDFKT